MYWSVTFGFTRTCAVLYIDDWEAKCLALDGKPLGISKLALSSGDLTSSNMYGLY